MSHFLWKSGLSISSTNECAWFRPLNYLCSACKMRKCDISHLAYFSLGTREAAKPMVEDPVESSSELLLSSSHQNNLGGAQLDQHLAAIFTLSHLVSYLPEVNFSPFSWQNIQQRNLMKVCLCSQFEGYSPSRKACWQEHELANHIVSTLRKEWVEYHYLTHFLTFSYLPSS